jgi:hypothetical protein
MESRAVRNRLQVRVNLNAEAAYASAAAVVIVLVVVLSSWWWTL